ncbi:MAG: hypothetical protein L6Q78_05690, partial [Bacteroidia bacterium]|nr:hypothetical protein [Bacteroidia bacterium]
TLFLAKLHEFISTYALRLYHRIHTFQCHGWMLIAYLTNDYLQIGSKLQHLHFSFNVLVYSLFACIEALIEEV